MSHFNFRIRFICAILLGIAVLCAGAVVHAATNSAEIDQLNEQVAEKKAKAKELEKSIESVNQQIRQKRLEAVSLKNQVGILENRAAQVNLDMQLTQNRLDATDLEIESLKLAIGSKEEVIGRQKNIVAGLVRAIHYNDQKKYIEIASGYKNFSEFYNQVQYVRSIEESLGNSVRGLRLAKSELVGQKEQVEVKRRSYAMLQEELVAQRDELKEQSFLKEDLLSKTQKSEEAFQALVSQLKSQHKAIEGDIAGIEQDIRRKLANNERFQNQTDDTSSLSWPTPSRYITARFRDPSYPYRHIFEHNAIDIRAAQGTALRAAASGYVARARKCTSASCYAYIMIVHNGGISTVYGHVNRLNVSEDQFVTRGDIIGYSGGTPGTIGAGPFVTGPHLHFEVRKNGIPVNPLNHLVRDWE